MRTPVKNRLDHGRRSDSKELIRRLRGEEAWLSTQTTAFPTRAGHRSVPENVKSHTDNYLLNSVDTDALKTNGLFTERAVVNEAVRTDAIDLRALKTNGTFAERAVANDAVRTDAIDLRALKTNGEFTERAVANEAVRSDAIDLRALKTNGEFTERAVANEAVRSDAVDNRVLKGVTPHLLNDQRPVARENVRGQGPGQPGVAAINTTYDNDDQVEHTKIATNAIHGSYHIKPGTLAAALNDDEIPGSKIFALPATKVTGTLPAGQVGTGLDGAKLQDSSVPGTKIASLDGRRLQNGTVVNDKIHAVGWGKVQSVPYVTFTVNNQKFTVVGRRGA